ncbi:MAG: hypothetical protein ACD_73C00405G0002 [uncultured bacterium]|nr:MAG: hypothetical protein ACD_73C00405G0002 [uncultured bacterium]
MTDRKIKIMLIDDEVDFATLLARRIQMAGYDVHCYHQGENAIDMVRVVKPDLIMLDINLPGISGLEIYKQFKVDHDIKEIPVVFISAMHEKENHCLYDLKAQGFLKKPSDTRFMFQLIEKVLTKSC